MEPGCLAPGCRTEPSGQTEAHGGAPGLCPGGGGPPILTHCAARIPEELCTPTRPQGGPGQRGGVNAQPRTGHALVLTLREARVGALGDPQRLEPPSREPHSLPAPLCLQAPVSCPKDRPQSPPAGQSNLGHPTPMPKRERPQLPSFLGLIRPLQHATSEDPQTQGSRGGLAGLAAETPQAGRLDLSFLL